jgi:hypothetical protein
MPSRVKVMSAVCQHALSTLRNPQAPDTEGVGLEEEGVQGRNGPYPAPFSAQDLQGRKGLVQEMVQATPRSWPWLLKVGGRHGAGVSVMLAQIAQKLEAASAQMGWEGGCHVIYFRAMRWHSKSYLAWYLCSAVSMTTAVRPSWRALTEHLVRRSLEHQIATVFVLDGIKLTEVVQLAEALNAARQASALALAIFSLESHAQPPALPGILSALSPAPGAAPGGGAGVGVGGVGGHGVGVVGGELPLAMPPCMEVELAELPVSETRQLVAATLRSMAARGVGASIGFAGTGQVDPSFVKMCEDKVFMPAPRPGTRNPNPEPRNPEPESNIPEPGSRNPESGTQNPTLLSQNLSTNKCG